MAQRPTKEERRAIAIMGRTMTRRAICDATGRPMGTVSRILKAYRETGRIEDAPRGRPARATSHEEDLLIVAASAANPFLSAKEIRDELGLRSVSLPTIRRRLHEAGIHSRVASQKTLLEESHRRARLEFASACESCSPDNWRAVVFTDEASFCTRWDVQRRVWRVRLICVLFIADELWAAVQEEWERIRLLPDYVNSLYDSLPRRIASVAERQGGPIIY
ncbi:hypothetical protein HPB52_024326 [Rhipicephalus sanguineus]|uniref:Transposase Tc1-like domain-containing protein n=1 Tax=Rhipicephalus sanguineus TaxID=34632 RepID=A0A9D4PB94_RHISA|nr:hypothetical protein HPB52_024326 [Rhipicephalus sanguineus]